VLAREEAIDQAESGEAKCAAGNGGSLGIGSLRGTPSR